MSKALNQSWVLGYRLGKWAQYDQDVEMKKVLDPKEPPFQKTVENIPQVKYFPKVRGTSAVKAIHSR